MRPGQCQTPIIGHTLRERGEILRIEKPACLPKQLCDLGVEVFMGAVRIAAHDFLKMGEDPMRRSAAEMPAQHGNTLESDGPPAPCRDRVGVSAGGGQQAIDESDAVRKFAEGPDPEVEVEGGL